MKKLIVIGLWASLTAHTSKVYKVTFYHDMFQGRPTRSGEIFDQNKLTCASNLYPFGTKLKLTNVENGKSVIVKVNDTGDFETVHLDLSKRAFKALENLEKGIAIVKLQKVK